MFDEEENNLLAKFLVVVGQVLRLEDGLAERLENDVSTRSERRIELELILCRYPAHELEKQLQMSVPLLICK